MNMTRVPFSPRIFSSECVRPSVPFSAKGMTREGEAVGAEMGIGCSLQGRYQPQVCLPEQMAISQSYGYRQPTVLLREPLCSTVARRPNLKAIDARSPHKVRAVLQARR